MDSLEATVRIIEAMLASDQCSPPFGVTRGQPNQKENIGGDHGQIDTYRRDFVQLFRTVHDSVIEANMEATEPQAKEHISVFNNR